MWSLVSSKRNRSIKSINTNATSIGDEQIRENVMGGSIVLNVNSTQWKLRNVNKSCTTN